MSQLGADIYDGLISTDKPSAPGTPFAVEDEDARFAWEEIIGPLIESGQAIYFRPTVKDKDLTAPPVLPPGPASPRARYIIAPGATGVWTGRDGQIAEWDGAWHYEIPEEGWAVVVADEDKIYAYLGPLGGPFAWVDISGGGGAISIANTWADGSGIVATDVEDAIEEIVADLADDDTDDGADRIGAKSSHGLAQGTVRTQLDQLADDVSGVASDLTNHLADTTDAHAASAISKGAWPNWANGAPPTATDVEAGLDALVSDLADNSGAGADGASRVGADGVAGSPHSLAQGTVGEQLGVLLGYHNAHLNDTTAAHAASAISKDTTPNWRTGSAPTGGDVETIVDSIVTDLADQVGTTADGASRIGLEGEAGSPISITRGSVRSGLVEVMDGANAHINDSSGAHAASAISKASTPNWRTGSAPSGSDVETVIDSVVSDLADQSGATTDGASRIGAEAATSGALTLAQGTIRSQLNELLAYLAAQELMKADPWGFRTTWTSASTITVTPIGGMAGDTGWVPLTDGSTVKLVSTTSAFTCALPGTGSAGTGPGSLHNSHSEAINTGYEYYWVWGAVPGLKLTCLPRGTAMDAAKVAALAGGGFSAGDFTHFSRFFWFTSNNNSGNLIEFDPLEERAFQYRGAVPIGTYTASTATQITFTNTTGGGPLLPVATKRAHINAYVMNASSSTRDFLIWRDSGLTQGIYLGVNNETDAGFGRGQAAYVTLTFDGLTVGSCYWAAWSPGSATTGATLYVHAVWF